MGEGTTIEKWSSGKTVGTSAMESMKMNHHSKQMMMHVFSTFPGG
jgi:hypothetical protein